MMFKPFNPVYLIVLGYGILLLLGIYYFGGTGDMGDSIAHFVFAKYAPIHPELYFHHWAKPVFVLLASPFAQFGFNGVKVLNATLALTNVYLTFLTAQKLNLSRPWMSALLLVCMPLNYIITLSSLTEPLFAFTTILSIYLYLTNNIYWALILLSFLPYVRSEGLIILGVFFLLLVYQKKYKALPLMLIGSVLYGIAGYPIHHNFFWVITEIPYAHLSSVYGSGSLFHFVDELTNVVGIPIYILVCLGLIVGVIHLFRKNLSVELNVLIYLGFLSFFIAHTLFWYLGIFNSMGLKRVFVGVAPLMAIISLCGYNYILDDLHLNKPLIKWSSFLILVYVLVFPFTPNPSAIQFKKDLFSRQEQMLALKVVAETQQIRTKKLPIMYNNFYLGLVMDNDRFNLDERLPLCHAELKKVQSGTLIIWDNKLLGSETDVEKSELDTMQILKPVFTYSANDFGQEIVFSGYLRK